MKSWLISKVNIREEEPVEYLDAKDIGVPEQCLSANVALKVYGDSPIINLLHNKVLGILTKGNGAPRVKDNDWGDYSRVSNVGVLVWILSSGCVVVAIMKNIGGVYVELRWNFFTT